MGVGGDGGISQEEESRLGSSDLKEAGRAGIRDWKLSFLNQDRHPKDVGNWLSFIPRVSI